MDGWFLFLLLPQFKAHCWVQSAASGCQAGFYCCRPVCESVLTLTLILSQIRFKLGPAVPLAGNITGLPGFN